MTEMYSGLHVGQRFPSLEDFKGLVRSISVRQHWELRVTRSNKKSVVIGCRSSNNCFFRVVCRANKNATYISSLQDSHSCRRNTTSTNKTPARSEASHVRFLLSEIPKLFDMRTKIKAQDIVDAVKRYHGYDISTRQAQRALIKLQQRNSQNQSDGANTSSGEDRQDSQPPPSEGQGDNPSFGGIPSRRWIPEPIQPNIIPQTPTVSNSQIPGQNLPPHSQIQHPQQVPPSTPQGQPPPPDPPSQEQNSRSHAIPPQSSSQQTPYSIPQLPAPPSRLAGRPKSPTQPQHSGHPSAPSLVLTNFKIEFTCTTCGALNQSFFPNQGNVTGRPYVPQHPPAEQAAAQNSSTSSAQAPPGSDGGNERAGDVHRYDRGRRASTRGVQSPWTPVGGSLEVPLAPAHSQNSSS